MADQSSRARFKEWLDRQAQLQPDGSYLIRPVPLTRMVFQVNAATKDRWVSFLLAFRRYGVIAAILSIPISDGQIWAIALTIAALWIAFYGGLYVILRKSPRVPADRWVGPAVVGPPLMFSRRRYLISIVGAVFVAVFFGYFGWYGNNSANGPYQWVCLGLSALMVWCAVRAAINYSRAKPEAHSR